MTEGPADFDFEGDYCDPPVDQQERIDVKQKYLDLCDVDKHKGGYDCYGCATYGKIVEDIFNDPGVFIQMRELRMKPIRVSLCPKCGGELEINGKAGFWECDNRHGTDFGDDWSLIENGTEVWIDKGAGDK